MKDHWYTNILSTELLILSIWFRVDRLSLGFFKKLNFIIFNSFQKSINHNIQLLIDDQKIDQVIN